MTGALALVGANAVDLDTETGVAQAAFESAVGAR